MLAKDRAKAIRMRLDANTTRQLIEEAMTCVEIGSTMPDNSLGSRWIANNPSRFLELYPDIVTFLRDHQNNPSTVYILESCEATEAISKLDLIDTYRRIILRHLPTSNTWFERLHENVIDDTESAYQIFLEWFETRMRASDGKIFARSFFNRYWAGELDRKSYSLSVYDPTAYRLRGGAIWKRLSLSCFVTTIEKIIHAGHSDVVCDHWMTIRVHLIDYVAALSKIEAALLRGVARKTND